MPSESRNQVESAAFSLIPGTVRLVYVFSRSLVHFCFFVCFFTEGSGGGKPGEKVLGGTLLPRQQAKRTRSCEKGQSMVPNLPSLLYITTYSSCILPCLLPPPPSATQRSALRVTVPTLTDRYTPCSPIHSSTLLLSDLSENTPIRQLKGFPVHLPHYCTHIHTRTHPELIPDDPLFTCMHAYITFIRL